MTQHTSDSIDTPEKLTRISDYVAWHAQRRPEEEAAVLDAARLDYRELNTRVDALARALIAAGVGKGDRVATLATPSLDYYVAFLAAASIGAIWLGLNPRYRLEELCYASGDAKPCILLARAAIGDRDYGDDLAAIMQRTPSLKVLVHLDSPGDTRSSESVPLEDFLHAGEAITTDQLTTRRAGCDAGDPCLIVYTSGSTGKPKGALLSHEAIVTFCLAHNRGWPAHPMRVLNYFPINHVGCVIDVSCPTLVAGGTIVFLEEFSPRRSLELIEQEKITLWGSVPSVFQLQLAEPDFDRYDLSTVQMIFWGGAAMPAETVRRLLEFGVPLATNYGMTESGSAITAVPPSRDIDVLAGTVGWPFPGVEVQLVDSKGAVVAEDETGEIHARSAQNMLGYWERPDATAETLSADGWLATGDLARRNADGSYTIVGRAKEMYKSGGYNVYPREVEQVIESHPDVTMAAVVSTEDPIWQEVGVAYVVRHGTISAEELTGYCRERLANYKLPKRFILQEELPLLPIGKVDKVTLKQMAARLDAPRGQSPQAGTD
jgi:acyl-CoA synthetase (AMP-forming)/AMP-acid ligase II